MPWNLARRGTAAGLRVRAWGVRDVQLMDKVITSGADGMTVTRSGAPHLAPVWFVWHNGKILFSTDPKSEALMMVCMATIPPKQQARRRAPE